ncbi:MAG TPA: YugN family protein [Chondromyces sp.]|nr:YugN family protein [Chondromyces sp.]
MIKLETDLEGKRVLYGEIYDPFKNHGFEPGGNWEFDHGMFDTTLACEGSETVYLRVPFEVVDGMLDESDALLVFKTPFVIKHIANVGLDDDESPVLATTGFDQF